MKVTGKWSFWKMKKAKPQELHFYNMSPQAMGPFTSWDFRMRERRNRTEQFPKTNTNKQTEVEPLQTRAKPCPSHNVTGNWLDVGDRHEFWKQTYLPTTLAECSMQTIQKLLWPSKPLKSHRTRLERKTKRQEREQEKRPGERDRGRKEKERGERRHGNPEFALTHST